MARKRKGLGVNEPLLFPDHPRPVTRRDFLRQGLISGLGMVTSGGILSLFANPRAAQAELSSDLQALAATANCGLGVDGTNIPFICFDLGGGANFAGSNVLVGQGGGQFDNLSTQGYSKLGLPGDMIPGLTEASPVFTTGGNGDYTNTTLGLAFHSDSALLAGIQGSMDPASAGNVHGSVIPARSENDTGNNPHNPMYAIAATGSEGSIVTLVGSQSSDSGGRSMAPDYMIDPTKRPTKIDRPSDVTGLVDTGKLVGLLSPEDAVAVLESVSRLSDAKLRQGNVTTGLTRDAVIKDLVRCGYIGAADIADRFGGVELDPALDTDIVGPGGIFTQAEFDGDGEFRKTASVMKMVIDGYAGAGTVTMGGYDYHTGDRETGERRDFRAGRCIGACLEYAARRGQQLMLYVFSDGSVFSNGRLDNSVDGRGKGEWTGDNQQTACSFFLVYNPGGRATPRIAVPGGIGGPQIGYFRPSGDVETASTPAANNVNLLVEMVLLNYLALHGEEGRYSSIAFASGQSPSLSNIDQYIAFNSIR